ncbi:MAG: hypothetical protein V1822_02760 [Candidatus Micrarchaeota archaeon]
MAGFFIVDDSIGAISLVYKAFESLLGPITANALFFIAGIYIFVIFYDFFFERLSRKEIFKIELKAINLEYSYTDMSFGQIFRFLIKSIVFFPILASVITVFTTIFLILLSKDQPVETIAAISMAVVMVVRILAYTNERLAKEVSKILPFSLLLIILTNPTTFAQSDLLTRSNQLIASANSLIPLFFSFIAIEIILQPIVQLQKLAKSPAPPIFASMQKKEEQEQSEPKIKPEEEQ